MSKLIHSPLHPLLQTAVQEAKQRAAEQVAGLELQVKDLTAQLAGYQV